MKAIDLFLFITNWALVVHSFYFFGIIPNTIFLASIILIGSILHNIFINQQYDLFYDVLTHYLPFIIVLYFAEYEDFFYFKYINIIFPYLIYMNLDFNRILEVYKRPKDAIFKN